MITPIRPDLTKINKQEKKRRKFNRNNEIFNDDEANEVNAAITNSPSLSWVHLQESKTPTKISQSLSKQ